MVAYVVTQEGNGFAVRLTSISGQVVATFSNKLAADNFAVSWRTHTKRMADIISACRR